MKNLRNSLFVILLMASAVATVVGQETPPDDIVKCKCTTLGKCKATGGGSLCAQSQPGGNVNCQDYNGNC